MTTKHSEEYEAAVIYDDTDDIDESGQGLAEYALILGLVAAAAVGGLMLVGGAITDLVGWRLFDMVGGEGD